jgi:hypothetical protein
MKFGISGFQHAINPLTVFELPHAKAATFQQAGAVASFIKGMNACESWTDEGVINCPEMPSRRRTSVPTLTLPTRLTTPSQSARPA